MENKKTLMHSSDIYKIFFNFTKINTNLYILLRNKYYLIYSMTINYKLSLPNKGIDKVNQL